MRPIFLSAASCNHNCTWNFSWYHQGWWYSPGIWYKIHVAYNFDTFYLYFSFFIVSLIETDFVIETLNMVGIFQFSSSILFVHHEESGPILTNNTAQVLNLNHAGFSLRTSKKCASPMVLETKYGHWVSQFCNLFLPTISLCCFRTSEKAEVGRLYKPVHRSSVSNLAQMHIVMEGHWGSTLLKRFMRTPLALVFTLSCCPLRCSLSFLLKSALVGCRLLVSLSISTSLVELRSDAV